MIKYVTKGNDYITSLSPTDLQLKIKCRQDKKAVVGERLLTDGLTADIIREAPDMMLKDLTRIKMNVDLYRLLQEKENEANSKIAFSDLAEIPYFARGSFPSVDLT